VIGFGCLSALTVGLGTVVAAVAIPTVSMAAVTAVVNKMDASVIKVAEASSQVKLGEDLQEDFILLRDKINLSLDPLQVHAVAVATAEGSLNQIAHPFDDNDEGVRGDVAKVIKTYYQLQKSILSTVVKKPRRVKDPESAALLATQAVISTLGSILTEKNKAL
jgi:hypothetical protein